MYQFKMRLFFAVRGIFIAIILLTKGHCADPDPCESYEILPDMEKRYANYHQPNAFHRICDKYSIPDTGQWYRVSYNMPTEAPHLFKCGTTYPIWLNGSIPTGNVTVNRTACVAGIFDKCMGKYQIRIKKCNRYYVYFLNPPQYCPEAYCFGDGVFGGDVSDFKTEPEVRPALETISMLPEQNLTRDQLYFICDFEPSRKEKDDDLLYSIHWKVGSKNVFSPYVNKTELHKTYLREDILSKLNIQITCGVQTSFDDMNSLGPLSSSKPFFAGIQVQKTHLQISEAGEAYLHWNFTVPISCVWPSNGKKKCSIFIDVVQLNANACFGQSVTEKCKISIEASEWNKTHKLKIGWANAEFYQTLPSYCMLKTTFSRDHIWDKVLFPVITVKPNIDVERVAGKICRSRNDPHQTTFQGRYYENQNPGTFIVYRYMDSDKPMEVQYKTFPCGVTAYCMCGVAVRGGADLFVINRCDNEIITGFINCSEKILDARKDVKNVNRYTVFFPTGTAVEINIGIRTLFVTIIPSAFDWKKTEGLCGFLSGKCEDDFRHRDGNSSEESSCGNNFIHPQNFSLSWRVPNREDLFLIKEGEEIGGWKANDTYCVCPNATVDGQVNITCSRQSTLTCERDKVFERVDTTNCKIASWRSNRLPSNRRRRKKRSTEQQSVFINMTRQEAEKYCRDFMNGSGAFKGCESVPNVPTAEAIEICVLDIELTSTLDWVNQTLESIKADCIGELRRNYTLQVAGDNGSPSVAEMITDLLCPGNPECSKRGQCINGTCICEEGFISPDCSVDITDPPEIIGLRGDGLCYTNEIACDTVYLVGIDIYKSVNLSCSFKATKTNFLGKMQFLEESPLITTGHHNTISEIWCQLPNRMHKGDNSSADIFVYGYEIRMSYDKINFGEPFTFYIIEYPCIDATETLEYTTFRITERMCLISSECYLDGTRSKTNSCSVCDPRMSQSDWSPVEGCPVKPLVVDYRDDTPNAIALIIGISAFVLIFIVVILLILRYLRSKKGKWDVAKVVYQQKKI